MLGEHSLSLGMVADCDGMLSWTITTCPPARSFPKMGEGGSNAARERENEKEVTIEPFLDMRDPTFRRILRAATSKFNQMICPLMASVCVRDLCMFWNDHSKSCLIVDTLKTHLYHAVCPKCQSTNIEVSAREQQGGKAKLYRCDSCGNEWGQVH